MIDNYRVDIVDKKKFFPNLNNGNFTTLKLVFLRNPHKKEKNIHKKISYWCFKSVQITLFGSNYIILNQF